MAKSINLHDDELSGGKLLTLLMLIVFTFIILWYVSNIPELQEKAKFYFWMGIFGIGLTSIAFIASHADWDFDMPIYSRKILFLGEMDKIKGLLIAVVCISVFLFALFSAGVGSQATLYEAPTLQVVELGAAGDAILSALDGIMESWVIIIGSLGILLLITQKIFENEWVSFVSVLILVPTIFTVYHTLRYGSTDIVATQTVFILGLLETAWVLVFRNIFFSMALHGGNNFALTYFRSSGTSPILLLYELAPYIIVIVAIAAVIWYWKSRM